MSIYKNFTGTMKEIFRIGGPVGNAIKGAVDGLSIRNATDTLFANLNILAATGAVDEHAVNWLDLKDANVLLQFNFDGASPPLAGDNTGTYGFCHTSGGAYSAGQVYYDDGTDIRATKIHVGTMIATGSAISGTISLNANGVYAAHSAAAPFTWTLKGDGSAEGAGYFRVINIPIDTTVTKSSTTSIPDGGMVYSVNTMITTPYDNAATISVYVDGISDLTVQPSDENDPSIADSYLSEVEDGAVTAATEGVVTVDITGSPSTGAGMVSINFAINALA